METEIRDLVISRFSPNELVHSVLIHRDEDPDGDPIVRITVVWDQDVGQIDVADANRLAGHVLKMFKDRGEASFPVVSFVSAEDFRNLDPEAA